MAWTQTAIEHDLIYLQTYRDAAVTPAGRAEGSGLGRAGRRDDRAAAELNGLKPAVVLDIDETVLDNSPYQARAGAQRRRIQRGRLGRPGAGRSSARALPGAVEFTQFAASHGIAVIYISNRAKDLDEATLANLRKAGLPVSGPEAFLGLGTVVEGCEQIGYRERLPAPAGQPHVPRADAVRRPDRRFRGRHANTPDGRRQAMAPYLGWIGKRWFVLPNPTYGSWEPALFSNDWSAPPAQRRQQKIDALRYLTKLLINQYVILYKKSIALTLTGK